MADPETPLEPAPERGSRLPSSGAGSGHLGHPEPRVPDRTVAWRMFAAIGAFMVVLALLYWFTAYEDAGTVLLALSAALALWFGSFLWLQQRHTSAGPDDGSSESQYLPHASIWPLVIGVGTATVVNGLVLGIWVIVPGLAALALGIGGFIRQSRRRD